MKTLTLFALFASSFILHTVSAAANPKVVKLGTFGKKTLYAQSEDKALEWSQAKDFCSENGFKLASIQSQAENDAVKNFVLTTAQSGANTYNGWLGLNDLAKDGVFEWVSGEPLRFKNYETEPGKGKYDNCVYINTSGKWSASYCELGHLAICQKIQY